MKKIIFVFIFVIFAGILFWVAQKKNSSYNIEMDNANIRIESSAFKNGEAIPSRFTCDGEGINPELIFKNIPKEAKSLALIVDDPDAPSGTWVHWVLWNISPDLTEIKEGSTPVGATVGANSWSDSSLQNSFGAPCPPNGSHRYFFKLYALDIILNIPSTAGSADLTRAMQGHILSQTELMGKYHRNK